MSFEAVAGAVAGVPFMSPEQGRLVYDHVRSTRPEAVLELGTAHGVSAAYMAAAVAANGGGRVVTVDRVAPDPSPADVLARAGAAHLVELVVVEHSSYTWWLKDQASGRFDFCHLDGAHNWHVDGLAVALVEPLLKPGAWMLVDDLGWTYAEEGPQWAPDGLSDEELREPHMRAVFEHVVRPRFTQLSDDGWWGWARKPPRPATRAAELAGKAARRARARLA